MECGTWLNWQIDYLLFLQCFRDSSGHIFDRFFLFITTFGEITIPIFIICSLYWAINKKAGQFLLWNYLFGFITNQLVKVSACIYRPWILDSRIKPLAAAIPAATGYSFPSGHTAGAMSVWGGLAVSFWKNKWVRYISIAIVLCVMFSRNYLGVHTPQDVVVSFLLSCFVLYGTYKLINWEEQDKNRDLIVLGTVFTVTVLTVLYIYLKNYPIHYLFGKILYDPNPIKTDSLLRSGFLLGAFTGWILEKRFIIFNPETGTNIKKVLRVIVGLILMVGLHNCGQNCGDMGILYGFVQHFIMGLFITCLYPFLIKRFNL